MSGGNRRDSGGSGESNRGEFIDKTVQIKRCAAVVKGGRRFSFAAMVVVGDGKGRVGWGYGKANEVPPAVEKGQKQATRTLVSVPLINDTIPHDQVDILRGRALLGRFQPVQHETAFNGKLQHLLLQLDPLRVVDLAIFDDDGQLALELRDRDWLSLDGGRDHGGIGEQRGLKDQAESEGKTHGRSMPLSSKSTGMRMIAAGVL